MSSAPHAAEMPARARWSAFVICLGAGFMALLDVSIVNVALPSVKPWGVVYRSSRSGG